METASPNPRRLIPALTSFRFLAAVAVLLSHSAGAFGLPKGPIKGLGIYTLMTLFFVLSGYIMFYCYPRISTPEERKKYYLARFARIWPLHVLTFCLSIVLIPAWDLFPFSTDWLSKATTAIMNLSLVHAWYPSAESYSSYNSVSWSISAEAFFYLTFPFVMLSFRRRWRSWLLGAAAIAIGAGLLCWAFDLPGFKGGYAGFTTSGFFHVSPFVRWIEFLSGVALAYAAESGTFKKFEARLSRGAWTTIESASFALLIANMILTVRLQNWTMAHGGIVPATWLYHSGALPSIVLLIYVFAQDRGALSRVLGWRPLVVLGEASFALYLLHDPILRWLRTMDGPPLGFLPVWLQFPVYLLTTVALSCATWRWFEMPTRKWILSRFSGARGPKPEPIAPRAALEA